MAKSRQQKEATLSKLQDSFAKAKTVVFVDYAGVTVEDSTKLRQNSKAAGSEFFVAKKTLIKRAIADNKISDFDDSVLQGNIGVVFGYDDVVAPAKVAKDFGKGKEKFSILAGIMEGAFLPKDAVMKLASLPSKQELYQKLVGTLNAPISSFARVLSRIAEKGEVK
ncbi:50S ribosomal protein L10 [Candidatus Falkowbacteria bacterium]|nr:50S ribosomal protein L10 [Candidatus Falkowbacteria bacterium]